MKRIVPLLLSLLLLAGCAGVGPLSLTAYTAEPSSAPAPTDGPKALAPFLCWRFYEQDDWDQLTSAVLFEADLDQDGTAEPVSFALRPGDEYATAITWGDSTVILDESDEFIEAAVLDLDTASPFYNLLVVLDYGSDSYVTIELHPEDGRLVRGPLVEGSWDWAEDALWFYERTDFLGTASGKRIYRGDGLTPESDWLHMCYIPTAEALKDERAELIEYGTLLHAVRPVPCTVDGKPSVLPADTYLYRLRFRADDSAAEVCALDGTVAVIACDVSEDGWPYLIDGRDATDYFDNLFFAD